MSAAADLRQRAKHAVGRECAGGLLRGSAGGGLNTYAENGHNEGVDTAIRSADLPNALMAGTVDPEQINEGTDLKQPVDLRTEATEPKLATSIRRLLAGRQQSAKARTADVKSLAKIDEQFL